LNVPKRVGFGTTCGARKIRAFDLSKFSLEMGQKSGSVANLGLLSTPFQTSVSKLAKCIGAEAVELDNAAYHSGRYLRLPGDLRAMRIHFDWSWPFRTWLTTLL
jgi:hypothetical protein